MLNEIRNYLEFAGLQYRNPDKAGEEQEKMLEFRHKGQEARKAFTELAKVFQASHTEWQLQITINVNDYVEHRAEVLQTYAQKLATRVLEEGRSHQTDPMSNSERKIIHRIISRMDGVTSYSEGDEPNRYVVVDTE